MAADKSGGQQWMGTPVLGWRMIQRGMTGAGSEAEGLEVPMNYGGDEGTVEQREGGMRKKNAGMLIWLEGGLPLLD